MRVPGADADRRRLPRRPARGDDPARAAQPLIASFREVRERRNAGGAPPSLEGMDPPLRPADDTAGPRDAARVDRPRGHRAAVPALRDGPDRAARSPSRRSPPICSRARTELLWIVDIYGFLVAGLLITMGTLGDRIGRRRLLLIGAAAFGAASVLAAFAPTRRDADRGARAARHRGRDARAVDAVADPQHVPRRAAAHGRDRRSGSRASRSAPRSARSSAACCSSSSGGARCSCSPCR